MVFLKIAWRNVLRQKRRSILAIMTVAFGVAFAVFMKSLVDGASERMIQNAIELNTGHIQLYKKGYPENEALEYTFQDNPYLDKAIKSNPSVRGITKRVEAAGLVSLEEETSGAAIIGIQPEIEERFTVLKDNIKEGGWLRSGGPKEALISDGIAKSLNVKIGNKLAVLTQTYYGSLGAELFTVKGIFKLGNQRTDQATVFITLEDAQSLMNVKNMLSRIMIWLDSADKIGAVKKEIEASVPQGQYELLAWDEIIPEVTQLIGLHRIVSNVLFFMLLLIVFASVFNTMLTSVTERMREFGIMFALGIKPRHITMLIFMETVIVIGAGILFGDAAGAFFSNHYSDVPITFLGPPEGWREIGFVSMSYCRLKAANILLSSFMVMVIGFLGTLYPIHVILKSRPVETLRFI